MDKSDVEVLVIGGGYAGISLLNRLKKYKNFNLTLIDKTKTHLLQTHLHKYVSGYYDLSRIAFDHEQYCRANGISFFHDEINSVNYSENYATSKEGKIYRYDYLVIVTGSRSIFPHQIQNIMEHARDIKDLENLDFYRNKFLKLLNSNPQNVSIVVVGGGLSGVQVACELSYVARKKELSKDALQVTIVEAQETILPELDNSLIEEVEKRCKELDVAILTNSPVAKVFDDRVVLANGDEIGSDITLFLIGYLGNNIANNSLDLEETKTHQIVVDEYYRVGVHQNAFAIGDVCLALDKKTNEPQAATAQNARMQADLVAKNIVRDTKQETLEKNNVSNKGVLIDLGGPFCATGKLFGVKLYRNVAAFVKKIVYLLHTQKFNS